MTAYLPPNLLALFAAREPIPYLPPVDKLSHEKKRLPFSGLADHLSKFEVEFKDEPTVVKTETREEKKERKKKERLERAAYKLEQDLALWDPQAVHGTADPYKTLFVARISYDTSESKLRREFEEFGPVRKVYLIKNRDGKSRGYAFVEYEHERDMHAAYKHADGRKIDGRRVVVDYERGRTVKGWRPRRLGGGLGGEKRRAKISDDTDDAPASSSKVERRPSREREPERDRDRRDKDHRSDRDRDRRRRSRTRSRSRSRDRKRVKEEKRPKDKKDRDRSGERDRKDRKDRSRNDDSDGRRRRRSSGSDQEPAEYKPRPGAAAFDGSEGETSPNGKDRNYDGSSQGF